MKEGYIEHKPVARPDRNLHHPGAGGLHHDRAIANEIVSHIKFLFGRVLPVSLTVLGVLRYLGAI